MIKAEVVADSLCPRGHRLTTFVVTFPRIILAELNTHRMLSKNSASSRAIPFKKMVESVRTNPFIPIAWQVDHSGMQGVEYVENKQYSDVMTAEWLLARDEAANRASNLNAGITSTRRGVYEGDLIPETKVTKQLSNRLLEAYMYHTVIISGTEWENFFALRCPQYTFNNEEEDFVFRSRKEAIKHYGENEPVEYETGDIAIKDLTDLQWLQLNTGAAEIHMMALAEAIWDARNESTPKKLEEGDWHIPYEDKIILPPTIPIDEGLTLKQRIAIIRVKISTAMCARVSYTVVGNEKEVTSETLLGIHDKVVNAKPLHASPLEHCAQVPTKDDYFAALRGEGFRGMDEEVSDERYQDRLLHESYFKKNDDRVGWFGNFRGFKQYRKMIPNENIPG